MNRKLSIFACIAIFISLQTGCIQIKSLDLKGLDFMRMDEFHSQVQSQELQTEGYAQKVDSFIIVLDSSSSMGTIYQDEVAERYSRFMIAKDIVSRMNNTIPEMDIQGTLQRFGYGFAARGKLTEPVYGPTAYSTSDLEYALQTIITPGGHSPAGLAIGETSKIVGSTEGKSAVIVISDGEKLNDDPLMKVKTLKKQFGGRTCLYTIWVGSKTKSKAFMEEIAAEMGCGFSVAADDIATSEGMEDFVRKVFFAGDSDGDGVTDDIDVCLGTPKGAIVDQRGCWVVKGVKFDYKKWDVKPQFNTNLDNIISVLKNTPDLKIRVEGHTDNIGSEKYNLGLSKKRAESIKAYLVEKGIEESRITSMGHGLSKPRAGNDTKAGRALNRRAELIPVK